MITSTLTGNTQSVAISNGTLYIASATSSCGSPGNGTMVVWSNTAYTWQFISQSSAGSSDYYAIAVPGSNPPLVLYDRTTAGHIILVTADQAGGPANWAVPSSSS